MIRVVNLRHETYDAYIGRAGMGQDGYFGNPVKLKYGEQCGSCGWSEYRPLCFDINMI